MKTLKQSGSYSMDAALTFVALIGTVILALVSLATSIDAVFDQLAAEIDKISGTMATGAVEGA